MKSSWKAQKCWLKIYFDQITKSFLPIITSVLLAYAQAIKVLSKIGIEINEEQAKDILDFLYLLAKTYHDQSVQHKQREGDF